MSYSYHIPPVIQEEFLNFFTAGTSAAEAGDAVH